MAASWRRGVTKFPGGSVAPLVTKRLLGTEVHRSGADRCPEAFWADGGPAWATTGGPERSRYRRLDEEVRPGCAGPPDPGPRPTGTRHAGRRAALRPGRHRHRGSSRHRTA